MKRFLFYVGVIVLWAATSAGGAIPADGLVLHLDASALGLNDQDPVSVWPDLSGQGNNASVTLTECRPTYAAAGSGDFNSQAYVHFDGIDDWLSLPDTTCPVDSFRWIMVARSENHSRNEWMVGSEGVEIQFRRLATGGFRWRVDSYLADISDIPGGVHIYELESFDTTVRAIFDGRIKGIGTSTSTGHPTGLTLGDNEYSPYLYPLLGDIAEVIVYNRELTEAEENAVGCYLEEKYGLQTTYHKEDGLLLTDGLILHLDGSSLELENGDLVGSWPDTSGQGNDAFIGSEVGDHRLPLYVAPGTANFNGQAYVHFDGIDDYMGLPMNMLDENTWIEVGSFRWMVVARCDAHGVNEWLIGSTGVPIQLSRLSTGKFHWRGGSYIADVSGIGDGEHLFELEHFNGTVRALFDGDVRAAGACGDSGYPVGLCLAANPTGGSGGYLAGDIAEVIVFGREPSAYEENYVGYYLQQKYALATNYPETYMVDAGDNQTIRLAETGPPAVTNIEGVISPYAPLAVRWTQIDGPATVQFGDDTAEQTTASLPIAGVYVLQFALADEPEVHDTLTISVTYTVDAGEDQVIAFSEPGPAVTTMTGTIIPAAPLAVQWTQVIGPAPVQFADSTVQHTTVSFPAPGIYVLRLALNDDPEVSDTVAISVGDDPYRGQLPVTEGLVLYLDASALELNEGDPVSLWPDLSGRNNNASMTGYRCPEYVALGTTDFNGRAYVHFDGVDDRLTLPDTTCSVGSFRWIIVARSDPHDRDEWLVGSIGTDIQLRRLANGGFRWRVESYLADAPDVPGGVHLWEIDHFHGTIRGMWDGQIKTLGACADSGYPAGLTLGGNPSYNDQPLLGDIAEVIVFNRPLTAAEENAIGEYLEKKYNLGTAYPRNAAGKYMYRGSMLLTEGLVLYLDASELALNDGNPVGVWPDLSGYGNDAVKEDSNCQPVYVAPGTADFQGKAYVHFDGVDDSLALPDTTCRAGSFRLMVVGRSDLHGSSEWLVGSSGYGREIQLRRLSDGGFRWRVESYLADVPNIPGGVHLFEIDHFNGALRGLWDGMVKTAGACTDSGYTVGLHLGGNPTVPYGQPLLGDIAEVIAFNRPLTSYEENYVGYYLGQKYGLSTTYPETYLIDTGSDQVISLKPDGQAVAYLTGMVSPANESVAVQWSIISGPGTVIFADGSRQTTTATFTQAGDYVLQCAVTGAPQAADTLTITIMPDPGLSGIEASIPRATMNAIAYDENIDHPAMDAVNGEGLSAPYLHTAAMEHLWLSNSLSTTGAKAYPGTATGSCWLSIDFGRIYELGEMWVWNYNQADEVLENLHERGLKTVRIQYSVDAESWADLTNESNGTDFVLASAPDADGYVHNTEIDFDGAPARYVVITADLSDGRWGDSYPGCGLSELQFGMFNTVDYLPADFNRSGIVDIGDFSVIVAQWLTSPAEHPADLNGDDVVDLHDLEDFVRQWMYSALD